MIYRIRIGILLSSLCGLYRTASAPLEGGDRHPAESMPGFSLGLGLAFIGERAAVTIEPYRIHRAQRDGRNLHYRTVIVGVSIFL